MDLQKLSKAQKRVIKLQLHGYFFFPGSTMAFNGRVYGMGIGSGTYWLPAKSLRTYIDEQLDRVTVSTVNKIEELFEILEGKDEDNRDYVYLNLELFDKEELEKLWKE
ncbi:MAG TPA: hypothetical protein VMZ91_01400 [Candidatus Paceibacterota bacterium]|nr:hypothetical protein [Candidatus Paceibacterota bacterium]